MTQKSASELSVCHCCTLAILYLMNVSLTLMRSQTGLFHSLAHCAVFTKIYFFGMELDFLFKLKIGIFDAYVSACIMFCSLFELKLVYYQKVFSLWSDPQNHVVQITLPIQIFPFNQLAKFRLKSSGQCFGTTF